MTRYLLALACICTSAVGAAAGSGPELELALARRPGLYLVVDPGRGQLVVKARGMELDRVPLRAVELLLPVPPAGEAGEAEVELPEVWRVVHAPKEEWRPVVAPPTLVPYREQEEPPVPAVTATPEPRPPAQYRVELDHGWMLAMGSNPPTNLGRRLLARVRTGWNRLWGRPVDTGPPTLVVETSADDARRLLHMFRPGVSILLVDP